MEFVDAVLGLRLGLEGCSVKVNDILCVLCCVVCTSVCLFVSLFVS